LQKNVSSQFPTGGCFLKDGTRSDMDGQCSSQTGVCQCDILDFGPLQTAQGSSIGQTPSEQIQLNCPDSDASGLNKILLDIVRHGGTIMSPSIVCCKFQKQDFTTFKIHILKTTLSIKVVVLQNTFQMMDCM
jgi:hypothetical protein